MAMPQTAPRQGEWTVEDVRRLPDDRNRYEVVAGVLFVTPAPSFGHQEAAFALARRLSDYVKRHRIGWAVMAPADFIVDSRTMVEPDVFVAPLVDGRRPRGPEEVPHLLLSVEVLSPGTSSRDRGAKRLLYQQHADEYWIVDLDSRIVERWRPGDDRPEVCHDQLAWSPPGAPEPLLLDVAALFADVLEI